MTFWAVIGEKIKEIFRRMIGGRTIEQTLHVAPVISSQMEKAIELWTDMYKGQAPWIHEPDFNDPSRVVSLGLPALIASEKARMVLIEFASEITTPTKEVQKANPNYQKPEPDAFGNILPSSEPEFLTEDKPVGNTERAEFLNEQYTKLKKQLRRQAEYGIAKGGLVIKPYVVIDKTKNDNDKEITNYDIEFDFIQADCFYPLAFDASGRITEAAFIQTKADKNTTYRRLEYHRWEGHSVSVINKAFKSTNNTHDGDLQGIDLGQEVPLSEVPEWSKLPDKTTIKNVSKPLFAYFKMPEANTIDTTSPLGVSAYSRVVSLIKDADMQYSRLLWEYEAGEMAIDIDRDALNFMKDSEGADHRVMGHLQQRLYRPIDLGESETYKPFSPTLRDSNIMSGLNSILMRIEDNTGLSRGTLSDAGAEARTATELKILKQRGYSSVLDIQTALQDALEDVIYIMNVYCDLYEITPEGEYDTSFEWDDSIITDMDTELNKRITLMQNGLAGKLETRMWYFGETERQAQDALMKIEEEGNRAAEQNLMREMMVAGGKE